MLCFFFLLSFLNFFTIFLIYINSTGKNNAVSTDCVDIYLLVNIFPTNTNPTGFDSLPNNSFNICINNKWEDFSGKNTVGSTEFSKHRSTSISYSYGQSLMEQRMHETHRFI